MGSKRASVTSSGRDNPEFNIVLLGALGVGKSAMTVKYITRRFIMEYDPSLEDTYNKLETLDGQDIRVKIMDTYDLDGNSERYMRWAHAFAVVYSITSRPSYDRAVHYLEQITRYHRETSRETPVTLVGNKLDLERYRTVSRAEGEQLANDFESDCSFYETSAAEDYESVEAVFKNVIQDISRCDLFQQPFQPLFITEDKSGQASSKTAHKSHKSPRTTSESKDHKKEDQKDAKVLPRRQVSSFRLFNYKNFKIFN